MPGPSYDVVVSNAAYQWVEAHETVLAAIAADLPADGWIAIQVLQGANPVLEWVRGTALRPVLDRLSAADAPDFLAELGARLRAAYPRHDSSTVFPFRRCFAVGHRPAAL